MQLNIVIFILFILCICFSSLTNPVYSTNNKNQFIRIDFFGDICKNSQDVIYGVI